MLWIGFYFRYGVLWVIVLVCRRIMRLCWSFFNVFCSWSFILYMFIFCVDMSMWWWRILRRVLFVIVKWFGWICDIIMFGMGWVLFIFVRRSMSWLSIIFDVCFMWIFVFWCCIVIWVWCCMCLRRMGKFWCCWSKL